MINFKNGDLLEANVEYICHQVNCQGRMGSGIAKSIRDRWPVVYEKYKEKLNEAETQAVEMSGHLETPLDFSEILLGDIQLVPVNNNQTVINMFGQQYYGYDGKRYTSYDAFWSCLGKIKETVPAGSKIGFPAHIGCGLGGANWKVILKMIEQTLGSGYDIYVYQLEEV